MLERLLLELEGSQSMSVERLAARLETTPALIQMMLEHLARQGRVEALEFCEAGCQGCPLGSHCGAEKTSAVVAVEKFPPYHPQR